MASTPLSLFLFSASNHHPPGESGFHFPLSRIEKTHRLAPGFKNRHVAATQGNRPSPMVTGLARSTASIIPRLSSNSFAKYQGAAPDTPSRPIA
jgi:hypothetical protein